MANRTLDTLYQDHPADTLTGEEVLHVSQAGNSRGATTGDIAALANAVMTTQNWAMPFRGALLKRTSSAAGVAFPLFAAWQAAEYDTDGFWSAGAPTRLTVPPGVKKVRLIGAGDFNAIAQSGSLYCSISKNGGTAPFTLSKNIREATTGFTSNSAWSWTPVLDVEPGDYFELRFNRSGMASVTELLAAAGTFFALEVVEATDTEPRPFDLGFSEAGAVPASSLLHVDVAARKYAIQEDGGLSRFYAVTAPSAEVVLDVRKNGSSIGSITFAASGNTGAYTGARTDFDPGDVLTVHAPADPGSMAGLSVKLRVDLV